MTLKIKDIEDKIPIVTNLATNAALKAKINKVKRKIPSISNLATADALIAVENKIPDVSDLVKKADYDKNIRNGKKYFTTSDYNKFTNKILDSKITEKS